MHRRIADNRTIFDSVLSGIMIIDAREHTIVDINPAACAMFGDVRENVIGSVCHTYICPAEAGRCPITDLGHTVDNSERTLVRVNGQACPVLKTVTSVQFGGREYLVEAITDISVQKEAEAQLKKHKDALQELVDERTAEVARANKSLVDCVRVLEDLKETARERELLLHELISTFPGVAYQFYARPDGTTGLHYASVQTKSVFGLETGLEDLLEKFEAQVVPECAGDFIRSISQAIAERTRWNYEGRFRKPTGETIWFSGDAMPVVHEGEIVFNGVLFDVTERKRAEDTLRDREERYRALFENTGAATAIISRDTVISLCNSEFERLTGYSKAEIEGSMSWTVFTHHDDVDEMLVQHHLRRKDRDLALEWYEFRVVRRNGEVRDVYLVADIIPGTDETVASLTDITERKKMETELKAHRDHLEHLVVERTAEIQEEVAKRKSREEQYLSLVESMVEWVWETDADFIYTYVSPRIHDVLGYYPEELIGISPADIMPQEERERTEPFIRKHFADKARFIEFETAHIHKNGELVFIEANGRPYCDDSGRLLGYRGSCHDITARKNAREALLARERELTLKSRTLEEVNTSLKVLLKQREEDRRELEGRFVSNVRKMVLPYLGKIPRDGLEAKHRTCLDIASANLNEIVSPFLNSISQLNFTLKETEVAFFIRDGKTTREIAKIMGLAPSAIHSHRNNIRRKLNLNNKKANLRSYLMSLK